MRRLLLRRHKKKNQKPHDITETVMLPQAFGGGEEIAWRLWRPGQNDSVWLHTDDAPRAIEYMHAELEMKGVEKVCEESDDEDAQLNQPRWDRCSFTWLASVKDTSGTELRFRKHVPTKDASTGRVLSPEEFQQRKDKAEEEAKAWVSGQTIG